METNLSIISIDNLIENLRKMEKVNHKKVFVIKYDTSGWLHITQMDKEYLESKIKCKLDVRIDNDNDILQIAIFS